MKNQKLRPIQKRAHRDDRGYTLQTIIVMSILIAAAVGASVVLFRAVSTNTDVRSLTDLAGSNAPSRPHGFSVEKTVVSVGSSPARSVPSATIRWSPPLYTGQSQLEGTPASVLYKVDYGCADPDDVPAISELADITLENIPDLDSNNPTDTVSTMDEDESKLDPDGAQTHYGKSTELSIPKRIPEDLFPSSSPPDSVYCILQAQAYTCSDAQTEDCANPGDNAYRTDDPLTGREIYSLESESIRFELSRGVSEPPQQLETAVSDWTSTQNSITLSWNAPEYTGAGGTLIYEIQWEQRKPNEDEINFDPPVPGGPPIVPDPFGPQRSEECTRSNTHTISLDLNADNLPSNDLGLELAVDFRITPYTVAAIVPTDAVPPTFSCPTSDTIAGDHIDIKGILLAPSMPTTLNIQPSSTSPMPNEIDLKFESIPTMDAEKREALNDQEINVKVRWRVDEDEEANVDSYDLTWSRADGTGTASSLSVEKPFMYQPTPANPDKTLEVDIDLENDKAYNFNLTKNLSDGQTLPTNLCATITQRERTPTPEVEVVPGSDELLIRIAPLSQERFCNPRIVTLDAAVTQHYKVRVYDPATSTCTGLYPDRQCSGEDNQCVTATAPTDPNRPSAEEIVVTGLTASTTYEVEVIAGHTCDDAANTIGFTIPSSNPMNYGYPSAPVTQRATTTTASVAPAVPTNVSATFVAGADPTNCDTQSLSDCDRWNLSWTEATSGATGYLFTIDHDTSQPTPPDTDAKRYVYTPSNRETSFSARSPVGEFTCSKSGTTITCTVIDDDQGCTSSHTNLQFKVWSVGASGFSAAVDTSPTPSPDSGVTPPPPC